MSRLPITVSTSSIVSAGQLRVNSGGSALDDDHIRDVNNEELQALQASRATARTVRSVARTRPLAGQYRGPRRYSCSPANFLTTSASPNFIYRLGPERWHRALPCRWLEQRRPSRDETRGHLAAGGATTSAARCLARGADGLRAAGLRAPSVALRNPCEDCDYNRDPKKGKHYNGWSEANRHFIPPVRISGISIEAVHGHVSFGWSEDFDQNLNYWFWMRREAGLDDDSILAAVRPLLGLRPLEANARVRRQPQFDQYLQFWRGWKRAQAQRQIEESRVAPPTVLRSHYRDLAALGGPSFVIKWVVADYHERWLFPPDHALLGAEGGSFTERRAHVFEAARALLSNRE